MNTVLNNLYLHEALIKGLSMAEVYSSVNENLIYEFTPKGEKVFQSSVVGTAVRTYDADLKAGQLFIKHGTANINNWFEHAQVNNIPYALMPCEAVEDDISNLPVIDYEADGCIPDLFYKYKPQFADKGLRLEKLTLERYILAYKLANTHGVKGSGYKLLCSPTVLVTDKSGIERQYTKIFSLIPHSEAIDKLYNSIDPVNIGNGSTLDDLKIEHLLLSSHAVSELVYLLLFFLNDQALKFGKSYITENLDNLESALKISPLISIEENSQHNKIVGGSVDGEGSKRVPNYIFKNGIFKKLLSSFASGTTKNGSASVYRFDYNTLPHTKASKIYVKGGEIPVQAIIKQHDLIATVDTLQGIFESIDRLTFNFTALLEMKVYRYGEYLGRKTIKINSNLLKVLSSITLIAKEVDLPPICRTTGLDQQKQENNYWMNIEK